VSWIAVALVLGSVPQYAPLEGSWCAHLSRLTPKMGGGYPMIGAIMLFLAVLGGTWRRMFRPWLALGGVSYAR
jgi:hypothetical protein